MSFILIESVGPFDIFFIFFIFLYFYFFIFLFLAFSFSGFQGLTLQTERKKKNMNR